MLLDDIGLLDGSSQKSVNMSPKILLLSYRNALSDTEYANNL